MKKAISKMSLTQASVMFGLAFFALVTVSIAILCFVQVHLGLNWA